MKLIGDGVLKIVTLENDCTALQLAAPLLEQQLQAYARAGLQAVSFPETPKDVDRCSAQAVRSLQSCLA